MDQEQSLDFTERRVLGVLIEKSYTTPEQYPLTVNYIVNACNQKSCRDPLTQLGEDEVLDALQALRSGGWAVLVQPAGGRTDRWRQRVKDRLELTSQDCAVLAELLLRGPQSDGELRQNAKRIAAFDSLQQVQEVLEGLSRREPPLAAPLGSPGRRGTRWAHRLYPESEFDQLLGAEDADPARPETPPRAAAASSRADRFEELSARLDDVESMLAALLDRLGRVEEALGLPGDTSPDPER